jgi:hypothetical protein
VKPFIFTVLNVLLMVSIPAVPLTITVLFPPRPSKRYLVELAGTVKETLLTITRLLPGPGLFGMKVKTSSGLFPVTKTVLPLTKTGGAAASYSSEY